METAFYLIGGMVLLVIGAELLVKGASRIALATGLSPLVVGLTVVAYGTSSPELLVSAMAAFSGVPDIAVGNVVGSNICNVLLILGASALIAPLIVHRQIFFLDLPVMVGVSLLLLIFALDGRISFFESLLLLIGVVIYTAYNVHKSRREAKEKSNVSSVESSPGQLLKSVSLVVVGLASLAFGSRLLINSCISIAQALGISELVIGLTIVAVGTSLPELATSMLAAWRGERDIAVGNIIGSNIFNILLVIGGSGLLLPHGGLVVADGVIAVDLPVMVAVAILCIPIFLTGRKISRIEGCLFLIYYCLYTAYLISHADRTHQDASLVLSITYVIVPVTLLAVLLHFLTMPLYDRKQEPSSEPVLAADPGEEA